MAELPAAACAGCGVPIVRDDTAFIGAWLARDVPVPGIGQDGPRPGLCPDGRLHDPEAPRG